MYTKAKISCYLSYFVEGIVNNFVPLLFVFFSKEYNVSVAILALIALYNFAVQLIVDIASSFFIDKIGYKAAGIIGNSLALIGLILLALLPQTTNIVVTIFIASTFYCIGSGLMEVIISPIIENIPGKNKAFDMGIVHSTYSFGSFITIIISFFFFLGLGVNNWWILSLIFAIIPLSTLILFSLSKFPEIKQENSEQKTKDFSFAKSKFFFVLLIMMIAAGATEISVATWCSTYAELALKVEKPFGDLYGPAFFALTMAITRFVYAIISKKIKVKTLLIVGSCIALCGYLLTSLSPMPIFNFIGIILVGVGCAGLWPGTLSLTAQYFHFNAKMYSFLAAAGDIGCCFGSYFIGLLASGLPLNYSFLICTIFPLVFVACSVVFKTFKKETQI